MGLLVDDPSPSVARQARFGQTLIAFRAGIAGFDPPIPNLLDLAAPIAEDAQAILVRADADVVDAITSLQDAGDTFGVALGTDGAHRMRCLDFELALLLDQTVLASGLPALATTRPVLAGLVALHDETSDSWSTRWLVLVFPSGPAINVALHRRDGKQVMFGVGVSDTVTLGFALRGVRDTGNAPLQFDGRFSGVALGSRRGRIRTEPLLPKHSGAIRSAVSKLSEILAGVPAEGGNPLGLFRFCKLLYIAGVP